MTLEERILTMKKLKLGEIEAAAKRGDVPAIVSHTKIVGTLERLHQDLQRIAAAFESLEGGVHSNGLPAIGLDISPKMKGRIRREEFLETARKEGVTVVLTKGQKCRIGNNKIGGIAYASERTPNKWFLGLPEDDYDALVLLCEHEHGKVSNFIFPKAFYEEHRDSFSQDRQHGQIKFNVSLRGGRYAMKMPNSRDIDINAFMGRFDALSVQEQEVAESGRRVVRNPAAKTSARSNSRGKPGGNQGRTLADPI